MLKNKINGKTYIGQTIRPIQKRLEEHQKSNRCRALYNAIKKYGWGNFEKDYYECPDEDLNFDEDLLIREMATISPNGYNLREGGGSRGKHNKETKQKMRAAALGKPKSEEAARKSREARRGKTHTIESKKNMSEAHLGEKNHMYGKTGDKSPNSKRVYKYNIDGTFIESFGSAVDAENHMKKSGSSINKCARDKTGRHKTAYGFKWSYTFPYMNNLL